MTQDPQQNIIIYNTSDGKASVSLYAKDGELSEKSVVKDYLTTASDGKKYEVTFYSLEMILAIGFRVRSKRGIQFRQWANQNLKEYMIKGFVMDNERLKNPDGRSNYFDELLAQIRDIRSSEIGRIKGICFIISKFL